jgi:hypothetical protein
MTNLTERTDAKVKSTNHDQQFSEQFCVRVLHALFSQLIYFQLAFIISSISLRRVALGNSNRLSKF